MKRSIFSNKKFYSGILLSNIALTHLCTKIEIHFKSFHNFLMKYCNFHKSRKFTKHEINKKKKVLTKDGTSSGRRTRMSRTMLNMSTSSSNVSCSTALYPAQKTPHHFTPSLSKTKWKTHIYYYQHFKKKLWIIVDYLVVLF